METNVTLAHPASSGGSSLRSVAAVLAGLSIVVVASSAIDAVLHATGVYPEGPVMPASLYLLALAYRSLIQVAGGWLTARLAPRRPQRHVAVLAGVGAIGALAGVVASLDGSLGPVWYPIALFVLAVPTVVLGGLAARRT